MSNIVTRGPDHLFYTYCIIAPVRQKHCSIVGNFPLFQIAYYLRYLNKI